MGKGFVGEVLGFHLGWDSLYGRVWWQEIFESPL